ncbi:hypothetical protein CACET_c17190 [Clostridium aceticum]|uniref:Bypass of forespore C C-terminal domain-containing protein n=1 Tax=Clostridium aceticum TaxID=84022 RepID=A0A0D8IFQ6_9CLOT|nr:BofC C-terminal domain-containing protein [Clostridium aceticum]AKL95167.1 hypothetical protein CACET_c17190 [Clostridium aceticum]KJF28041.1 hypothetical protein TZ02_05635 [Clostridium aceticum]
MFRKRKRFPFKVAFFIIAFSFILVGFFVGYYRFSSPQEEEIPFAEKNNVELKEDIDDIYEVRENNEAAVTQYEDRIELETRIVYRTLYTVCENTIEEVLAPVNIMVGLNEAGFQEYIVSSDPSFEIQKFSTEEVILYQRKEAICPNHYNQYLITDSEGYIAIYHINEGGEKILVEKTSISIAVLPHVDQEKLKTGIFRRTREEAYQLLEDYSS